MPSPTVEKYLTEPFFQFQEICMAVHVCAFLRWLGRLGRRAGV